MAQRTLAIDIAFVIAPILCSDAVSCCCKLAQLPSDRLLLLSSSASSCVRVASAPRNRSSSNA